MKTVRIPCPRRCQLQEEYRRGQFLDQSFFNMYSADIIKTIVNCDYHIYADDIQLYKSLNPSCSVVAVAEFNADLCRIAHLCEINDLVLNPSKSKFMLLGTQNQINNVQNRNPKVAVRGDNLKHVSEARNLGLQLDDRLLFKG